jgi:hypothetical protein
MENLWLNGQNWLKANCPENGIWSNLSKIRLICVMEQHHIVSGGIQYRPGEL